MVPTADGPPDHELLLRLKPPWLGVMLYGSQARGDAHAGSDVDVLQLCERRGVHYSVGEVSVAVG
jgi:predicted nucleotidyltransferase